MTTFFAFVGILSKQKFQIAPARLPGLLIPNIIFIALSKIRAIFFYPTDG